LQRKVCITNPQGLHMRPSTAFAALAMSFQSTVTVIHDGRSVNGKSPLDMMMLAALPGSEITIEVDGPDAQAALQALAEVLARPAPE
jgi:phosphotransferase system HPr (HPr) family protein